MDDLDQILKVLSDRTAEFDPRLSTEDRRQFAADLAGLQPLAQRADGREKHARADLEYELRKACRKFAVVQQALVDGLTRLMTTPKPKPPEEPKPLKQRLLDLVPPLPDAEDKDKTAADPKPENGK